MYAMWMVAAFEAQYLWVELVGRRESERQVKK